MFRLLNKKGQSTAEYAILIGIIVAVAIAMQTYVKRGLQARVYDASNYFYNGVTGDTNWSQINPAIVTPLNQYEPQTLTSKSTQETLAGTSESLTMNEGGRVTRESTRKTQQAAGDYQQQSYNTIP